MATLVQTLASGVRRLAIDALEHLGGDAASELRETILLRDSNYLGRRFDAYGGFAVWLIDDELLTIYDHRGRELQQISTALCQEPLRRAA
jgi:hypothetical protein